MATGYYKYYKYLQKRSGKVYDKIINLLQASLQSSNFMIQI